MPSAISAVSMDIPDPQVGSYDGTYMFLNARGDGAVKVIVPTKSEKIAKLTPFARRFVGKISAVHANAGASTHCGEVSVHAVSEGCEGDEPGRRRCR